MRLKWKGWTAALLALAVLASGCSGSGGSTAANSVQSSPGVGAGSSGGATEEAGQAVADEEMAAEPLPAYGGASGASSGGLSAAMPQNAPGRMLIYKANLTMETENYADAYSEIQNLIHLSGGYIVQFSEQTSGSERSGLFTIKVPADDYSIFLERLESVPHRSLQRSMNAQDVSEEYVDLEARLKAKQVVEERYLAYMGDAERSEDLIRYTNELAAVQEEIERLKGRMRYLAQNVAYSTVELRLYERTSATFANRMNAGLSERMGDALKGSLNVLVTVAEGVMILLAGAIPIAAAAFVVGAPIYGWIRRRNKEKTKKVDF